MKEAIIPFKETYRFYFENTPYKLPANIKEIVYKNWKELLEKRSNIFNGEIICLKEVVENEATTDFIFNLSEYAHFAAAKMEKIPKEYKPKVADVAAIILTSDDYLAISKAGDASFKQQYQLLGGVVDFKSINGKEIDFRKCIKMEFAEELGLDIDDKKYVISYNELYIDVDSFSMIFIFKLNISSEKLLEKLKSHNDELLRSARGVEVEDFVFVNKDNYIDAFSSFKESEEVGVCPNLEEVLDFYFRDVK